MHKTLSVEARQASQKQKQLFENSVPQVEQQSNQKTNEEEQQQQQQVLIQKEIQLLDKNVWLDVKEKAERLVIGYESKFMPILQKTIKLLDLMIEGGLQSFNQQQIAFYIDEILFTVVKNIIEHKEYQTEENYLIAENIITKTLVVINQSIQLDVPKLSEILALIFNTQRSFYQKTILLKAPPQSDHPLGYEFERDNNRRIWEQNLKIGDVIDCVKFECNQRRQSWSRASIERIDDVSVNVKYLNDQVNDRIFTKSSYQIAPLGTKSLDFEWRENLKVGDEVDFVDSYNIWRNATILEVKEENQETQFKSLLIGLRIYRDDGNKFDQEKGKAYFGWDSQLDEWISPHSARLQKFNRLTRKSVSPQTLKNFTDYTDDANDIIFELENQERKIYAIQRTEKNNNLVRYLNYFGEIGGFDNILKRFQNTQNWCSLEITQYYLEAINNINVFLFLDFVREYIPLLWEATRNLLMNPSEANLRTYDKEKLESIIGSLEALQGRVYSFLDQVHETENLSMSIALKCYQTDVLKQRLAGLKLICEIIKYVKQNNQKQSDSVVIKPAKFVEWIKTNNIIEDLYLNNIHSEMINRSAEFFKFMLSQNLFTEQLARDMFNAIDRQDQMTKQGFLKLLGEISSEPRRTQAKYIIQNIKKTEPKELTIEHIEVIYELALKHLQNIVVCVDDKKGEAETQQDLSEEYLFDTNPINKNTIDALDYFYNLIVGKEFQNMSSDLKAKIIDRFSCLIRIDDGRPQRVVFLTKCIEDIKKNVSVYHLIQIIKQVIGTYYTELQLKGLNSNNNNNTNNSNNLIIKLNPINEDKSNVVNYKLNQQSNENKKRTSDEIENVQQKSEQEEDSENETPQKKKNRRDGALVNSPKQLLEIQQSKVVNKPSENIVNQNTDSSILNNIDQSQLKSKIADMLVNEQKLIETILQNIRQVKVIYKKKLDVPNISANDRKEILKQFRFEVSERIDFIKFINSILEDEKKIITTSFLSSIWKDIVENPLDIDERDLLFKWLRELADEKGGLVHEVAQFFKQQLLLNTEFVEHLSYEGLQCYKAMFISLNLQKNYLQQNQTNKNNSTANVYGAIISISGGPNNNNNYQNSSNEDQNSEFEYLVLTEPSNLEGIDLVWEIVYKNVQENVIENCIDFLVKLHLHITTSSTINSGQIRQKFIQNCMESISSSFNSNITKVKRTLDILNCLLNESEKKGIGYLKPINGLVKGEVQNLTITNELISYVQEGQKKQDIKIESNKTIIDLKILIASKINTSWDQIKIKRSANFKQLRDSDNSRTIGEIRFKSNENLVIEKRQTPPIPEANLLNPDGSLVEKAKQIFSSWFETYSADGLMDADNLAKFIHSCTNDNCKSDDQRVTGTISLWDHNKDGKLDLQDFLNFYRNACQEKKNIVWKNLYSHNYRNDLKKLSEVGEDVEDIEILPRNIIMNNPYFYELLMKILDNDQVSESAINLLNRLPASPDLVRKILNLDGVKGNNNPDWSLILDTKNSQRLLYTLTIIEYLMEDNQVQSTNSDEQNQQQQQQEQKTQEEAKEQQQQPVTNNNQNNSQNQNDLKGKDQPQQVKEDILKKIYSEGASIDTANWREEFIQCGGFDQLFKVFIQYSQQDYSKLAINTKNILSFILRIMKNYLTAVFANKVNHLYKINQYAIQVKYSLDVINENLKKAEEQKNDDEEEKKDDQKDNNNTQKQSHSNPQVIPYNLNYLEQNGATPSSQNNNNNFQAPIVGQHSKISFNSIWVNRIRIKETPDFLILKEKLSGKLGQKIMDTLDIESMLNKIIEILFNVVSLDSELESEDRVIIDFCWCIIIDIVLYDSKQLEQLAKNSQQFQHLIMKGLFNQNLNARRVFSHALYLISRQDKGVFSSFLLDLLMKNVPSSKDVSKSDCNQYYELFCKIIEESTSIQNVSIDFQNLMDFMIQNIKDHISQESRYNAKNDKMLIGFLNMCEKILKIKPSLGNNLEQFAEYLFDVCLFCKNPEGLLDEKLDFEQIQSNQVYEFNPPYYVKCKSSDSRRAAYKILNSILRTNKKTFINTIKDGLNILIDTMIPPISWSYRPSNEQKCHQNYLGIKNLSQICYMNSMLQQFYMTKTFRYAILATDDEKEAELVQYRGVYIDDNILHQIQKMFAFLDLSDRQDYNPIGFCFSFKDYAGQPVNVGVQQDAQEFLNMIFEKLEASLKPTPFKYVLESVFGGQTISQMTCSSCGNVKSKNELFYTQQLRVEGCKELSDSFNKMIEGETISDYKCDACQKKCDQFRRICFSQLPNILIIQLQRIVYDLDTYANKKINTKLEFPHNLDLKEYTLEYLDHKEKELKVERKDSTNSDSHLIQHSAPQAQSSKKDENQVENNANNHPPEYYKYRLKGVTVHQGTAELGHYYSYINYKEDKWLEFNDSRIKEFNPQNIEQECFGGSSSSYSEYSWEKGENSKNAYILVYERELKTPLKIVTKNEEQRQQVEKSLNIQIGEPQQHEEEQISYVDYYSINQRIPQNQFKSTWLDNHNFMLEKHVYSLEFLQFLKELICMIEKPKDYIPSINTQSLIYKNHKEIPEDDQQIYYNSLQMCAKLFFNIFYKSADFEILKDLMVHMKGMLDLIPQYTYEFAKEFIFSRFKQIESVLTQCSEGVIRSCYQHIVNFTINNLISYYNIELNNSEGLFVGRDEDQFSEAELAERDILVFMDSMLNIMHTEVSKNWLRMQQYLELFRDFAYGGDGQLQWCFNKEMIARLIDFFLGNGSPLNCYGQKKHEIGNRFVQTPYGPLLQTVSYLIQKVKWTPNDNQKVYQFSGNDQIALSEQEFYWKSMQENYDSNSICLIGQFMSHKELLFSQSFGTLILRGINKTNCDHVKQYLDLMSSFLAITDEYQQSRIEWIFGYGNLVINPNDGYEMKQNLEEQIVIYETRLKYEVLHPVLNLLYHYRKLQENLCLHILHRVLLMSKSDQFYRFLHYLMKLPAPSYCCSHYLSWVRPHLESIINENQKNYMSNQKEELAKSCLSLYEELEKVINTYAIQLQNELNQPKEEVSKEQESSDQQSSQGEESKTTQESTSDNKISKENGEAKKEESEQQNVKAQDTGSSNQKGLMSLWKNYIIGKTTQIAENRWIPVGEENDQSIYLRELEYTTYYTESKPNGITNQIFPDEIKCGNSIQMSSVNLEESNITDFIYIPTQNNSGQGNVQLSLNINKQNKGTNNEKKNIFEQPENNQDDSIDSFKAHIGEEVNHSGLPSTSNYGLNLNQNPDEKDIDDLLKGSLDEAMLQNQNNNLTNDNNIHNLQTSQNQLQEDDQYFLSQIKNAQLQQPAAPSTAQSNEPNQKQYSELVCVTHAVNLEKQIGNVIRRFQIENNSDSHIQALVNFQFKHENSQQNINQHMPFEIYLQAEPKSTVSFFSIRKINPSKDWSEYSISVQYEVLQKVKTDQNTQKKNDNQQEQYFTKASNLKNQQDLSNKLDNSNKKPEQTNQNDQSENNAFRLDDDKKDGNEQDEPGMYEYAVVGPSLPQKLESEYYSADACPVCTFIQTSINTNCEMCGSSLK